MMALTLTPLLPIPALLLVGGLILVLTLWSVLKKPRGVWFRFLASLLLLASLFNPQMNRKDTRPLKDVALVLIDNSSSQSLAVRQKQTEQAVAYLKKETGLYQDLDVRIISIEADGKEDKLGTRLITPLKQALSTLDPKRYAGSVIISDGQIHDLVDTDNIPGPVHLMLSGSKTDIDRRVEITDAPRYGLVGDTLTIRARVFDNGKLNSQAPIRLIKPNGDSLAFNKIDDGFQEVHYSLKHAGQSVLIIESDLLENEISHANNKIALNINGVRDRLRVLLVSGMPHQGQRTWRNILRSDPAVDLVHFTILRPSEKEDFTPLNELSLIAFPVRELFEEKLHDFDLIIFDRYYKHNVLSEGYFDNITQYVKEGGALLVSAGPDFSGSRSLSKTRLNAILPVHPTGKILQDRPYRLNRSAVGKRHPITSNLGTDEKKWGRWIRLIETSEANGNAILENDQQQPILIVDRIEEGRIAMLLSDQIWMWARGFDGGGPHSTLVRNLVQWLMKEPDLEEEKLSLRQGDDGQLEISRQTLSAESPTITLTRPDGQKEPLSLKQISPGLFSIRTSANAPGIYQADDGEIQATIAIGSINPNELIDPRASAEPMKKLIHSLNGGIHWLEDGLPSIKRISASATTAGKNWFGLRQNRAETVIGVKTSPALPGWLVFLGVAGLLTIGWWREGR